MVKRTSSRVMTDLPLPPGTQPFHGLRLRGFAGEGDLPAMCAVANACFAAAGVELVRTSEDMARDYASFNYCDPSRDVCIAELHGELAGYVRGSHWVQGDGVAVHAHVGFVAPPWRRRGIGTILLAWIEERHRRLAAEKQQGAEAVFQCSVWQAEQARTTLLQAAGYQPARHFFTMVRREPGRHRRSCSSPISGRWPGTSKRAQWRGRGAAGPNSSALPRRGAVAAWPAR